MADQESYVQVVSNRPRGKCNIPGGYELGHYYAKSWWGGERCEVWMA